MLPHYSPLKVAESFTILAALYPGPDRPRARARRRHRPDDDLRAPARPPPGRARRLPPAAGRAARLLRGRRCPPTIRSAIWPRTLPGPARAARCRGCWAPRRRARSGPASSGCATRSPTSSTRTAPRSHKLYRERFEPGRDLQAPRTAVAAWVLCAPTDEEAQELASSSRMTFTLLRRGQLIAGAAAGEGARVSRRARANRPPSDAPGRRAIIGSPEKVRAALEDARGRLRRRRGDRRHDHLRPRGPRRRSYELLAEVMDLEPRAPRRPRPDHRRGDVARAAVIGSGPRAVRRRTACRARRAGQPCRSDRPIRAGRASAAAPRTSTRPPYPRAAAARGGCRPAPPR